MMQRTLFAAVALAAGVSPVVAQSSRADNPFFGTWQAKTKEGPRQVIIRPDSSASYGDETVRWRLAKDVIWLALGGEWVDYRIKVTGTRMVLSGGDLTEAITLVRTGPPTPRPPSVPVPPDPDQEPARPAARKPTT